MPMRQSQLKIFAELIRDSDKNIRLDLNNDTLILKIQRNEIYTAFALIGLLGSCLLFYFRKKANINFELGIIAFVFSFVTLIQKQIPNKKLIFNSTTNSLTIIPSFFLNKLILKAILKTNPSISFNKMSEIKISYAFLNNQSRWTLYFKERFWVISLLSFTDKEKTIQICGLLNEMRI